MWDNPAAAPTGSVRGVEGEGERGGAPSVRKGSSEAGANARARGATAAAAARGFASRGRLPAESLGEAQAPHGGAKLRASKANERRASGAGAADGARGRTGAGRGGGRGQHKPQAKGAQGGAQANRFEVGKVESCCQGALEPVVVVTRAAASVAWAHNLLEGHVHNKSGEGSSGIRVCVTRTTKARA